MTTTMPAISPPEVLSDEEIEALERPYRRLDLRLYTVAEVARILDQPYHRIYRWAYPADSQNSAGQTADHPTPPIIYSREPKEFGWPTIPFVGLAQAQVAAFLFQSGATSRYLQSSGRSSADIAISASCKPSCAKSSGANIPWRMNPSMPAQKSLRTSEVTSQNSANSARASPTETTATPQDSD